VILHRCFARDARAAAEAPGGPLFFPRARQGDGRHDNPFAYGVLYVSEHEQGAVVEQLAVFRGRARLEPWMLVRRSLPLALAAIEFDVAAEVIDLDDPAVLAHERLRPSRVATRERAITQPQALDLFLGHERAAAIRWWSSYESLWANLTVFDRAGPLLRLADVRVLGLDDPAVVEAAELLDLV